MAQDEKVIRHMCIPEGDWGSAVVDEFLIAIPENVILPYKDILRFDRDDQSAMKFEDALADAALLPAVYAQKTPNKIETVMVAFVNRDTHEPVSRLDFEAFWKMDTTEVTDFAKSVISEYFQEHPPTYPTVKVPGYEPAKLAEDSLLRIEYETFYVDKEINWDGHMEENETAYRVTVEYKGCSDGSVMKTKESGDVPFPETDFMTTKDAVLDIQKEMQEYGAVATYVSGNNQRTFEPKNNRSREETER